MNEYNNKSIFLELKKSNSYFDQTRQI